MKFKKLLASITAVALATSTMAVTSFTSFATVTTGSNDCGTTHNWVNGACTNTGSDGSNACDATCDHTDGWGNNDGTCSVCKATCSHPATTATSLGDGTNHKLVCDTCGKETVASEACTPASTYVNTDGTNHWKVCTECGTKITSTEAAHDENGDYDKDASQHWKKCSVCGGTKTGVTKTNHTYDQAGNTCVCGATDPDAGSGGGDTPAATTVEIAFPTSVIQLTVGDNDGNATEKKALASITSTALGSNKTYGDLKNTTLKLTGVNFENCSIDGVTASDVQVVIYTQWKSDWSAWKTGSYLNLSNANNTTFDLSTITGVDDADPLQAVGIQVYINDQTKLASVEKGDTVKVNDDGSTERPVTGSKTIEANNYWNQVDVPLADLIGNLDRATGVLKIAGSSEFKIAYTPVGGAWADVGPDTLFTVNISEINSDVVGIINTSASTTLNVTWAASIGGTVSPATPADPNAPAPGGDDNPGGDNPGGGTVTPPSENAPGTYTGKVGEGDAQPKIPVKIVPDEGKTLADIRAITITVTFSDGSWGGGCLGMNVGGEWKQATWSNESATGKLDTPNGIDDSNGAEFQVWWFGGNDNGKGSATYTITYLYSDGTTGSGSSGGGSNPPTPGNPGTPDTPSLPVSNGTLPSTAVPKNDATGTVIVDTITSSAAASLSFSLGSNTKIGKEIIDAIAAKGDVTVRFNVAGGAYWEINGANVTSAKAVDLGVRMNSKLIPASKVEEFAGDKTTVQLSLRHNGDLGFTGVLNVPINKSYNGKFANLYYYNGGKFDFVGSAAIAGGRAQFAFSHASNYLIVIDDYAYGEDVSSAAGMTETTEASAVPYVAALVVVSAFAASAVVLKKRLSK